MVHQTDLIIYLADFNATTAISTINMENTIGSDDSGIANVNTEMFLSFRVAAGLRIRGSCFSNNGFTKKEIYYILVNTKWFILKIYRAYRTLDVGTDHGPSIATIALG